MQAEVQPHSPSLRRTRSLVGLLLALPLLASASRGPVTGFNTTTPYLVYYGNWDSTKVNHARNNYRLVILHPSSNITAANIASIRRGPDSIAGTADDVLVLAYVSVGEDDRPGAPFVGDGQGPRVDPRSSDSVPLSSITNALGLPSPGGTGYASYYLDTKTSADGIPDRNSTFGGCFVNAGDPAWWNILKTMTKLSNGRAGLDEILTTTNGNAYNCDGVFLDTLDTAAPNSFGLNYEWTAPGMQALVERISTNYPAKLLMGNRGLFFFNPNLKTYAYTLRPHLNMVMFESYYTDSSNSGTSNAYFADNKFNFAPKINAEAGRPDGFTVVALGYDSAPAQPPTIIAQDYVESMKVQGWTLFRTDPALNSPFQTNATLWLATNADNQMPEWDSTAAQSSAPPAPRVGIQQAVAGDQSVTVRWDVARDQTGPVRYNLYYTNQFPLNFATAAKLANVVLAMPANYANGTGPGSYPYEYTVTGLSNGVAYAFAVRAEDSASPSHEDTNTVTLSVVAGTNAAPGTFRSIIIDGNTGDWAGVPVLALAPLTNAAISFASLAMANDSNYLYLRFSLHAPAAPFSDFNTHVFLDTDNSSVTGYHPSGLTIGSELLIESGAGYDERNGSFNAGSVTGLGWLLGPAGTGTDFEARISRQAQYAGGALVFTNPTIRVSLQDNRGSVLIPQGVQYTFASGDPYENWRAFYFTPAELNNPAISGDGADASGDGIANLVKYAFDLNPRVVNHPSLPAGFIDSASGTNYFHVNFVRRNPPAGVQYIPQVSVDLVTWNSNPTNFAAVSIGGSSNNTSIITLRLLPQLSDTPGRFVRIAIHR